ncbi:RIO kinase 1 [Lentzea sp. NBRC 105346]|uniref:serine protein kinase RIO n=1 Tax=Lentzea sp. NBRC 105346 TaxID=3032205 RepID=UPI0024A134BD|nr:RIO1 family regulatory kinase/ATPase [Lentzea sp. NBRC 105346]GLZ31213.1 RIO kinase 1 [Lentzea sp. NBRC 105346]
MREHDLYLDYEAAFDDTDTKQRKSRRSRNEETEPTRRGRMTEQEKARVARAREDADDVEPDGDRWSTWGDSEHGPKPYPNWLVTELAATDRELGIVKTGKEADVFLLERGTPDRSCLLAAKRYRSNDHRMFHRDAGYLEGRRMKESRMTRAIANRTAFGRNLIAEQWAVAEFAALGRLWQLGAPVPYPVQRSGTELLLEFIGDNEGTAAPRLAQTRPDEDELLDLWRQLVAALMMLAEAGLTHGDLSAYNLMVHDGRLILIDLPQIVDIVANPRGVEFLHRDVQNVAGWFAARGLPPEIGDPAALTETLLEVAGLN